MEDKNKFIGVSHAEPISLRPHHGMCLAFFSGHGYSSGFTMHMQKMKDVLNEDAVVKLVVRTDSICSECPNNISGECEKPELVFGYDKKVLTYCGLSEGQELTFTDFSRLVSEKVLDAGLRCEICGDCQWNELCE